MYRNLQSLTMTAHLIVDLSQPGREFELKVHAMAKLCLSAQQILQSSPGLKVRAKFAIGKFPILWERD
jgi:hypothetical protein